jgi:transcriptional regulator with GAF, ATPase, and Fis domain
VSFTTADRQDVKLVGQSAAIRAIDAEIDRAARSDAKVLITGETGSGKEVVARLIHRRSSRALANLVTLNCAGLPDSLLESELFGHARGSFTGAYRDKPGLLEMAPNGTVFLDEVGEMSTRMQVVLLRFLETGEIQRLGGDGIQAKVNVRLITATNRDLRAQIETGAFREDLYFRLNVIHITVPSLRDRPGDVPLLVDHFLGVYTRQHRLPPVEVTAEALAVLDGYAWPGNVRELKNVVERMVLKAGGHDIRVSDLPQELTRGAAKAAHPAAAPTGERAAPDPASRPSTVAEELTSLMVNQGESFWSAVYPVFMARDMTRADLRRIVQTGLELTNGNYRMLVRAFNMADADYKRFLSFLRKHDCHLPFQRFRTAPARLAGPAQSRLRAV